MKRTGRLGSVGVLELERGSVESCLLDCCVAEGRLPGRGFVDEGGDDTEWIPLGGHGCQSGSQNSDCTIGCTRYFLSLRRDVGRHCVGRRRAVLKPSGGIRNSHPRLGRPDRVRPAEFIFFDCIGGE